MTIRCCYKCNRPWKTAYCHSYCWIYREEDEKNKADLEAQAKQRYTQNQLNQQTADGVNRAKRHERRTRKWFA